MGSLQGHSHVLVASFSLRTAVPPPPPFYLGGGREWLPIGYGFFGKG